MGKSCVRLQDRCSNGNRSDVKSTELREAMLGLTDDDLRQEAIKRGILQESVDTAKNRPSSATRDRSAIFSFASTWLASFRHGSHIGPAL